MKRVLSFSLACVLVLSLAPAAFADVDLSGMSFDELVSLKDQINLAIWNSADWQEVTVPQGIYKVGADIPSGKWTIIAPVGGYTVVKVGSQLDENGTDINFRGDSKAIRGENYSGFAPSDVCDFWTVELREDQYVAVKNGDCVFTPYAGNNLGFK